MTFTATMSTVLKRFVPFAAVAGIVAAMPTEAHAMISDSAATAAAYWQELLIGSAVIGVALYLDTASWSMMTAKARRR